MLAYIPAPWILWVSMTKKKLGSQIRISMFDEIPIGGLVDSGPFHAMATPGIAMAFRKSRRKGRNLCGLG
jgi:hypothetical protein